MLTATSPLEKPAVLGTRLVSPSSIGRSRGRNAPQLAAISAGSDGRLVIPGGAGGGRPAGDGRLLLGPRPDDPPGDLDLGGCNRRGLYRPPGDPQKACGCQLPGHRLGDRDGVPRPGPARLHDSRICRAEADHDAGLAVVGPCPDQRNRGKNLPLGLQASHSLASAALAGGGGVHFGLDLCRGDLDLALGADRDPAVVPPSGPLHPASGRAGRLHREDRRRREDPPRSSRAAPSKGRVAHAQGGRR